MTKPSMAKAINETCPTCTEPSNLRCSRCRNIKYCSTECQDADFPSHKLLCSFYKNLTERPDGNGRLVLFFPTQTDDPVFLWTPLRDVTDENGEFEYQSVEMENIIGTKYPDFELIDQNMITGTPLKHLIMLHYTEAEQAKTGDEDMNRAVHKAANASYVWHGPLLAICGVPSEDGEDIVAVKDMDMYAYSAVVAFLTDFKNETLQHEMCKGPKIQAVRVLCDKEVAIEKRRFQSVFLPRYHPLVTTESVCIVPLSKVIGLNLAMLVDKSKQRPTNEINQRASVMLSSFDPGEKKDVAAKTMGFGWPPMPWNKNCGSVYVLRDNLQPLTVNDLELFLEFCISVVLDMRTPRWDSIEDDAANTSEAREGFLQRLSQQWMKWVAASEELPEAMITNQTDSNLRLLSVGDAAADK